MSSHQPSLRERQAEELRASLRTAFVQLILERGGSGFSLHDVAAAAGVSDRTLYRHYPSREALIEAVTTEEVADLERQRQSEHTESRVALYSDTEWIADVFELFDEHGDVMRALRMMRAGGEENPASAGRTRLAREQLRESGIHPDAIDQLTALLRLLTGGDAWARMVEPDLALEAREAGYAAQWAAQVLVRAALGVDGPLRPVAEDPDGEGA